MLSNDVFKERTRLVHDMVKKYMKIVDTTVLDMAPKYIIMSLVKAVSNLQHFETWADLHKSSFLSLFGKERIIHGVKI